MIIVVMMMTNSIEMICLCWSPHQIMLLLWVLMMMMMVVVMVQMGGYYQKFHTGFTFVTVQGAGHMVRA